MAVADDKLTLAATDGNHRVDGLDAGLEGLLDRLAIDDAGGLALDGHLVQVALDGTLAVDRLANGVDDTSQHALAHAERCDAAGTLHGVALIDGADLAKHHDTGIVLLKVLHNALVSGVKLDQLAALCIGEAVDTCNAVTDGEHGADFLQFNVEVDIGQLLLQYCRYFGRFDI